MTLDEQNNDKTVFTFGQIEHFYQLWKKRRDEFLKKHPDAEHEFNAQREVHTCRQVLKHPEKCFFVNSFSTVNIRELFENFRNENKQFLIIKNAFELKKGTDEFSISLIIKKRNYYLSISTINNKKDSKILASMLKEHIGTMLYSEANYSLNNGLSMLYEEISKIKFDQNNLTKAYPFRKPLLFNAQSIHDWKYRGSVYDGSYQIKDDKYGDTSDFLIIGILLNTY